MGRAWKPIRQPRNYDSVAGSRLTVPSCLVGLQWGQFLEVSAATGDYAVQAAENESRLGPTSACE